MYREKTERERLQTACERKDEESLSETMKQAEKEQHYRELVANYEEQLKRTKASDEDFARMKIQNQELQNKAQEAMATLEEVSRSLTGKAEEIGAKDKELAGLKETAKKAEETIKGLRAELGLKDAEGKKREGEHQEALARAGEELKRRVQEALAASKGESGRLQSELAALQRKLDESESVAKQAMDAERARLSSELESAKSRLTAVTHESEARIRDMGREVEKCVRESRAREDRTRELEPAVRAQKSVESKLRSELVSQVELTKLAREDCLCKLKRNEELEELVSRLQKGEALRLAREQESVQRDSALAAGKVEALATENGEIKAQLQDVRKNYAFQVQALTRQQSETIQVRFVHHNRGRAWSGNRRRHL